MATGLGLTRPHYLLEINRSSLIADGAEVPDWVETSLYQVPFVVVRRATACDSMIPVGVRGGSRAQRFAAWVKPESVKREIAPSLLLPSCERIHSTAHGALKAFALLATRWRGANFNWGPAGSAGFELATGFPVVNAESDLDIVIYADQPMAMNDLMRTQADVADLDVEVDIQVETLTCGFSLSEYCREYPREIILKTQRGPLLGTDPWA